jgi:hypothetical protein
LTRKIDLSPDPKKPHNLTDAAHTQPLSSEEYLPDLNVNLMKTFIGTELK